MGEGGGGAKYVDEFAAGSAAADVAPHAARISGGVGAEGAGELLAAFDIRRLDSEARLELDAFLNDFASLGILNVQPHVVGMFSGIGAVRTVQFGTTSEVGRLHCELGLESDTVQNQFACLGILQMFPQVPSGLRRERTAGAVI